MKRALAFVVGAVCVWGCGDSGPSAPPAVTPPPVTPAPPPPPEPPPDPEGDIVVGFAQERVEIREGQTIPLEVRFDADINLSRAWFHQLTVPLRVTVEGESGSPEDVVVARRVAVYGWGAGRTPPVSDIAVIPIRAREDGLSEERETLRLRLSTETDPAESVRYGWPVRVAFRRAEIEVVILDGADRCSGVRLTTATPRRSQGGASCQHGIYETDITVESDTTDFLRLDPDPTSQILSIRSEPAGAGFRHELTVRWKLTRLEWDFRFRPCPDPGRGPAQLSSNVACRVFAEGEPLPPPERPICSTSLGGDTP